MSRYSLRPNHHNPSPTRSYELLPAPLSGSPPRCGRSHHPLPARRSPPHRCPHRSRCRPHPQVPPQAPPQTPPRPPPAAERRCFAARCASTAAAWPRHGAETALFATGRAPSCSSPLESFL
ncbi:death-associated protein-like 1 isoform X1 [Aquila chrysaetos chrysaetos]|uniref:death-associated protein-like 1 isoform X1 n=1 Tax=Aquila chrysaetos chrysaetos TaxID=223781 RepID=UPI001B7D43A2|nr:death-associated protein-like 1 isoform X1 [Aquila chrysaetos chrysaetos]